MEAFSLGVLVGACLAVCIIGIIATIKMQEYEKEDDYVEQKSND